MVGYFNEFRGMEPESAQESAERIIEIRKTPTNQLVFYLAI